MLSATSFLRIWRGKRPGNFLPNQTIMNKKMDNPKNGTRLTPVVVAIIGAFLGSSGTIAVYLGTPAAKEITRPDPFTGTDAAFLEQRVATVERRVDLLPPRELELAVNLLRHDLDEIARRIENLESEH